jgi:hypothetical protein
MSGEAITDNISISMHSLLVPSLYPRIPAAHALTRT